MGQYSSTQRPSPAEDASANRIFDTRNRSFNPFRSSTVGNAESTTNTDNERTWRRRSTLLLRRQSALLSSDHTNEDSTTSIMQNRRSRILRRAQSSMSGRFRLRRTNPRAPDDSSSLLSQTAANNNLRPALRHSLSAPVDVELPSSPISSPSTEIEDAQTPVLPTLTRTHSSTRPTSLISDRLPSFRPDRLHRTISNTLRRRRPSLNRGEEQTPVLSQLLSAAAAATAASIFGDDPDAVRNARGIGGDEGTLENFLESLTNGRMASALNRTARAGEGEDTTRSTQGINLIRLFRFGSSTDSRRWGANTSGEYGPEGRMVPIIIVGIRSIPPNSNTSDQQNLPSFIDALVGYPEPTSPAESVEGDSRLPNVGSRFSQRRRASLQSYENQRHRRSLRSGSPRPPRPFSSTSETSAGPYPPPSTPASAALSAFSSGTTTPNVPSQLGTGSALPSRRPSVNRVSTGGEPGVDDQSQIPRRTPRRRRLSESDFTRWGSGSSRRNGVVEPDDAETSGSRSWIIYVLGGSYPENHPLLHTPSLFTDQPTYEDMMLLSTLIGPAKPPVASEDEVASAPGLYALRNGEYPGTVIGISVDSDEIISVGFEERCLVCLSEFEAEEQARKLVKCGHLFHKDCIDQVHYLHQRQ